MSSNDVDARTAYMNILGVKYLSMVSYTLLAYDILTTLPTELRYVWNSHWSFGRAAFHANRIWAPIVLAVYVPSLFMYNLSNEMYLRLVVLYLWIGSCYVDCLKRWFLVSVCLGCLVVSAPSLVFLQVQAREENLVPNPAPDLISGCIFKSNPLAIIPYIAPFLYETVLFVMTVYKTWQISRKQMATPILGRLMRDGSNYYFVVIGTLVFVGVGSLSPRFSPAVNGSGIFLAVLSSMCSRLILSTRSFYDEANVTDEFLEMNTLPTRHPQSTEWVSGNGATSSSSGDRNVQTEAIKR